MFSSMQNPKILVCKQIHWMGNLVVNIIIYNVQRCQKRLLFDDKIKKDVPTKIWPKSQIKIILPIHLIKYPLKK